VRSGEIQSFGTLSLIVKIESSLAPAKLADKIIQDRMPSFTRDTPDHSLISTRWKPARSQVSDLI